MLPSTSIFIDNSKLPKERWMNRWTDGKEGGRKEGRREGGKEGGRKENLVFISQAADNYIIAKEKKIV